MNPSATMNSTSLSKTGPAHEDKKKPSKARKGDDSSKRNRQFTVHEFVAADARVDQQSDDVEEMAMQAGGIVEPGIGHSAAASQYIFDHQQNY